MKYGLKTNYPSKWLSERSIKIINDILKKNK